MALTEFFVSLLCIQESSAMRINLLSFFTGTTSAHAMNERRMAINITCSVNFQFALACASERIAALQSWFPSMFTTNPVGVMIITDFSRGPISDFFADY